MNIFLVSILLFLLSLLNPSRIFADFTVISTDLGTLGGDNLFAYALNDLGTVVGVSQPPIETNQAWNSFLWSNGTFTNLNIANLSPRDINNLNQIVGEIDDSTTISSKAFIWQNGIVTYIDTFGSQLGHARFINNNSEVAGEYNVTNSSPSRCFIWKNGITTDLGTLGGNKCEIRSLNDNGQIVGISRTVSGQMHAFIWENGIMTDLGTLGGVGVGSGLGSEPSAINNFGQVVGYSYTESGFVHAFLWENGIITDLGTLGGNESVAMDINDSGKIVGWADTSSEKHAFLWNGVMTDIGNAYSEATRINNEGRIVGRMDQQTFFWENGSMNILPLDSTWVAEYPTDFNEEGQILTRVVLNSGYERGFIINIQTPSEAIQDLVNLIETFNLQQGIDNSLDAKLGAAQNALSDVNQNNNQAAINALQSFINAVEAQRGNRITNEQANQLIAAAQAIINSLSN